MAAEANQLKNCASNVCQKANALVTEAEGIMASCGPVRAPPEGGCP
jgi:hypothetical protein